MDMIICEACGCPVHPDYLQVHSDWHDDLLTLSGLPVEPSPVANPSRIQR